MIRTQHLELVDVDLTFFRDLHGMVDAVKERAPSIEAELNPIEVLEGLDELKCHLLVTGLAVMLVHAGADHEAINRSAQTLVDFLSILVDAQLNSS